MNEATQIILSILCLGGVFLLSRYLMTWQMRRASNFIIRDLRNRHALNPDTAVSLPYVKRQFLKIGLRDYRPKVLQGLLQHGVVNVTEAGNFYLQEESLNKLNNA